MKDKTIEAACETRNQLIYRTSAAYAYEVSQSAAQYIAYERGDDTVIPILKVDSEVYRIKGPSGIKGIVAYCDMLTIHITATIAK